MTSQPPCCVPERKNVDRAFVRYVNIATIVGLIPNRRSENDVYCDLMAQYGIGEQYVNIQNKRSIKDEPANPY